MLPANRVGFNLRPVNLAMVFLGLSDWNIDHFRSDFFFFLLAALALIRWTVHARNVPQDFQIAPDCPNLRPVAMPVQSASQCACLNSCCLQMCVKSKLSLSDSRL